MGKVFLGLLAGLVFLGVFLGLRRKYSPIAVEATTVKRQKIERLVSASGTLKSEEDVALKFETSGKIVWLPTKIGDAVKELFGNRRSPNKKVTLNGKAYTVIGTLKKSGGTGFADADAVGATPQNILVQFLTEAVVLSSLGGAIGIALGYLGSLLISRFIMTAVTPWSVALSFSFAMVVGIVFGIAPAFKAAKKDPIEALRYE